MSAPYVTLDGYEVYRTTEKALGLVKTALRKSQAIALNRPDLIWVPKSCCLDGDWLHEGSTDIVMREDMADEKGLDYE